jgi:lipoprotein-releasing system permease protein
MGVAYKLGGVAVGDSLWFHVPSRGNYSALLPMSAFSSGAATIDGVFAIDADTDGAYVIAPLDFVQKLFDYDGLASALSIRTKEGEAGKRMQEKLATLAGEDFVVLSRYEQKASMYRIMALEKWGVFFIGLLVLIIASFSIVGSLVMLVIDKRQGIRTLGALGADVRLVRSIFVRQGMMIGVIGAAGGLVLGVAVCAVQQIFGVIPMPGASFLVDSYPVSMRPGDIAAICAAMLAVNYIIVKFTVLKTIGKRNLAL